MLRFTMPVESTKRICPVIYWSQTNAFINISVDLLLDDIVSIYCNCSNCIRIMRTGIYSFDCIFVFYIVFRIPMSKSKRNTSRSMHTVSVRRRMGHRSIISNWICSRESTKTWVFIQSSILYALLKDLFANNINNYSILRWAPSVTKLTSSWGRSMGEYGGHDWQHSRKSQIGYRYTT